MSPFDMASFIMGYQSGKRKAENATESDQKQKADQNTDKDTKQAENEPEDVEK